jgi:hypothetical protein
LDVYITFQDGSTKVLIGGCDSELLIVFQGLKLLDGIDWQVIGMHTTISGYTEGHFSLTFEFVHCR